MFCQSTGVKPQCLLCQLEGHIKKNCPRKSLKCDRCKGVGHSTNECNFARAINKQNAEALLNAPDDMGGVISTDTLKLQFEKEKLENEKKQREIEQKKKHEENKKKEKENKEQKNNSKQEQVNLKTTNSKNVDVKNNNAKRKVEETEIVTPPPNTKNGRGIESALTAKGGTSSSEDSLEKIGDE